MATHPKLKEQLSTNIGKDVVLTKRGSSYPNKFKEGTFQYHYIFRDQGGNEYTHYATEKEEETLKMFSTGDALVVTRREMTLDDGKRIYFLDWTAQGDISLNNPPQVNGNTREDGIKRQQDKAKQEQQEKDEKWEKREIQISLAGLTQAYIAQGDPFPLEEAVKMRERIIKKAAEIHAGITLPEPSTTIEEVNEAFGTDTPPLPDSPADYQ